jgi:hypothetical protein
MVPKTSKHFLSNVSIEKRLGLQFIIVVLLRFKYWTTVVCFHDNNNNEHIKWTQNNCELLWPLWADTWEAGWYRKTIAQRERQHNTFLVLYDVKQVQAAEESQRRAAVSSKCRPSRSPLLFPSFFSSYCDVSYALSYFASTILRGLVLSHSSFLRSRFFV